MFRNRFVSVGADIAYGNTSRLRSLNIDIVHTGRTDGNQLKLRIIRNNIGRNDNLIGDDDVRTAYALPPFPRHLSYRKPQARAENQNEKPDRAKYPHPKQQSFYDS